MSDFKFSFLLANGKAVDNREPELLSRYEPDELKPVRQPVAFHGQRHCPGHFWFSQLNEMVWYESRLEMMTLRVFDFETQVRAVLAQPFLLHYKIGTKYATHVPDYLVWKKDGSKTLVNVKPRRHVNAARNVIQFSACRALAEQCQWSYETHSEPHRQYAMNLNWLSGYRKEPFGLKTFRTELLARAAQNMTVAEVLHDIGTEQLVRPTLFYLMWQKAIVFDLYKTMSDRTRVSAGRA